MNEPINRDDVENRLRESDLDYEILELNDQASVIITATGGRILGPFLGATGESFFWINPAFRDEQQWSIFRADNGWNIGGERIWIAPEIQFSIRDRSDIPGSWSVPRAMDPGHYAISRSAEHDVNLSADMDLEAFNLATGTISLSIHRAVASAENPLRHLRDAARLMEGVVYYGYHHNVCLRLREPSSISAETWNLIQVPQGGVAIAPLPLGADAGWYWKPEHHEVIRMYDTVSTLAFVRGTRFKVGFRAAQCNGTVAYMHRLGESFFSLLIRRFFVNPSGAYREEPFFAAGDNGYALHFYNSEDPVEAFGEIECNGQAIGGQTGRTESNDDMLLWAFLGPPASLKEVLLQLSGVSRSVLDGIWPDLTRL